MRLGADVCVGVAVCAVVACTRSGDPGNDTRPASTTRDASTLGEAAHAEGSGALAGRGAVPTEHTLSDTASLKERPSVFDRMLSEAEVLEALSHTAAQRGDESERLNEWIALIYARRGREFGVGKWAHFAQLLPWYRRDPSYTEARLTPTDRANLELLERLRRRYPPLNAVAPPDPNSEVSKDLFPGCPPGARANASPSERAVVTLKCVEPIGKSTRPHDPSWTWYPHGRLASTEHYVHGKLNGRKLTWYSHGARRDEQHYVKGAGTRR